MGLLCDEGMYTETAPFQNQDHMEMFRHVCWLAGCLEYVQLMSTSLEGCYQHVFDSTHLMKLGRNFLMDRILKNDDCPIGFSIQNLFTLWENDPIWKSRFTLDDLCIQQTR